MGSGLNTNQQMHKSIYTLNTSTDNMRKTSVHAMTDMEKPEQLYGNANQSQEYSSSFFDREKNMTSIEKTLRSARAERDNAIVSVTPIPKTAGRKKAMLRTLHSNTEIKESFNVEGINFNQLNPVNSY
jgi:hypothetical protein